MRLVENINWATLRHFAPSGSVCRKKIFFFSHNLPLSTTFRHILKYHFVVECGVMWWFLHHIEINKKNSCNTLRHIEPQNGILKYGEMWLRVTHCGWKKLFFCDTLNHLAQSGRINFSTSRHFEPIKIWRQIEPHCAIWRQVALFLQVILFDVKVGLAWAAFAKLKSILRSPKIKLNFKIRLFKAACISILLYGCET